MIVDGAVLGTVPRAETGAFRIASGKRSLLVRAEGRGVARRIEAKPETTKLAFDIPRRPQSAPEPVGQMVFTGSRLPRMGAMALVMGVIIWLGGGLREGRPLKTTKTLKDHQGGKVVCRAGQIGAGEPLQAARLRAALRWFADDIWVEQPTTP